MELSTIFEKIEKSREDIVDVMCRMIRIPALAPVNGGDGEGKRADMLLTLLEGFDEIVRDDIEDDIDPTVMRPNIIARKKGPGKGTVWIIAHMDTVPAGDLQDWSTDPFDPIVKDGRIYGRGTEDNGQAIVSALFASKFIPKEVLENRSIGIAYVADEETSSKMGIEYLIRRGYFSKDDVFIVPDWGSPKGDMIDVSEKNLIWLQFDIIGKSVHGSTPGAGINALKVGTRFLSDLLDAFEEEFSDTDDLFDPPVSTFEPTKADQTVMNINTIPGNYSFSMDIRPIPKYSPDDVLKVAKRIAGKHEDITGAEIKIQEIQRHVSGKVSSTSNEVFKALAESIESVVGVKPRPIGVGGATCANFFRLEGYDAYVWEYGGGTLHGPNEYVEIENIITDAKVFAMLFYKLCVIN